MNNEPESLNKDMIQPRIPVQQEEKTLDAKAKFLDNYSDQSSNPNDLSELFKDINGVFIDQKPDWKKNLTGCAQEQEFKIFDLNNKENLLLSCSEKSKCCDRCMLLGCCRPFEIFIKSKEGRPLLRIQRDYTCTCFCLNLPFASVYLIEENKEILLGKINEIYVFCKYKYQVVNASQKEIYTLNTPCCQKGILCPCPCDSCNHAVFDVNDEKGKLLGEVEKFGKGCCKTSFTTADEFVVLFASGIGWQDKALLISAVLFLNFMLFEDKQEGGCHSYGT